MANPPPALGDADSDEDLDLIDIYFMIDYMYTHGPAPFHGPEIIDVDGNDLINMLDIVYLIRYLFAGGPEPVCP
jgi:hypothetical protein